MEKAVSELVERVADADIVVLGESHVVAEHRAFACKFFQSLGNAGFENLCLELDHTMEGRIPSVLQLPVEQDSYIQAFPNRHRRRKYSEIRMGKGSHGYDVKSQFKLYGQDQSKAYNFLPDMLGNPIAYHSLLKCSAASFKNIRAVDVSIAMGLADADYLETMPTLCPSIDILQPTDSEGMILRNEWMAHKIAQNPKGVKAVAYVGGLHTTSYKEQDGTLIPSLQSILNQKYGIKAVGVWMTAYTGGYLSDAIGGHSSLKRFGKIGPLFFKDGIDICSRRNADNRLPQHLVAFSEDQIFATRLKYDPDTIDDPKQKYDCLKQEWEHVCRQNGVPEFIL